jgi:hypothetical protein
MKRALIMSFVLSLLTAGLAEDEKPCTTHIKGKFYDLNPLKSKCVPYYWHWILV